MNSELLKSMSREEKNQLLAELKKEANNEAQTKREAYEQLRSEFLKSIKERLVPVVNNVSEFKEWLNKECTAFKEMMTEYGQLKRSAQRNFVVKSGSFKLEVTSNNVKGFDERADIAAQRLQDYFNRYIEGSELGKNDPVYKLAMSLLEKNSAGDFDYKTLSKLYQYENDFDEEYCEIMTLFKESHIVQKNATNFYFYEQDENGVWHRIEPSFNRL